MGAMKENDTHRPSGDSPERSGGADKDAKMTQWKELAAIKPLHQLRTLVSRPIHAILVGPTVGSPYLWKEEIPHDLGVLFLSIDYQISTSSPQENPVKRLVRFFYKKRGVEEVLEELWYDLELERDEALEDGETWRAGCLAAERYIYAISNAIRLWIPPWVFVIAKILRLISLFYHLKAEHLFSNIKSLITEILSLFRKGD